VAQIITGTGRNSPSRSDRPQSAAAYADTEWVADTIAVMDATGIDRAVLVGLCTSSWRALLTAGQHPDRVLGVVAISPWAPFLTPPLPARVEFDFDAVLDTEEDNAESARETQLDTRRNSRSRGNVPPHKQCLPRPAASGKNHRRRLPRKAWRWSARAWESGPAPWM
jgi:pimeloyl-ACP methyl ester carboxylesterase